MLLSKLAARPNKSGIAPHVETSDRELRVCAPRDDTAQTGEPARPPPLVNAQKTQNSTAVSNTSMQIQIATDVAFSVYVASTTVSKATTSYARV